MSLRLDRGVNAEMPSELGKYECLRQIHPKFEKALSMHSSYTFTAESAVFDEQNLVSAAGLLPGLELASISPASRMVASALEAAAARSLIRHASHADR
jgi:hypothetical protein